MLQRPDMRGVVDVYLFECRFQRGSPLFIIVASVFALMTFLGMASDSVQIGGNDAALNLNSVFAIVQTHIVFSIIGLFPAIAFVATAITRDHETRTAEVFYSTGIAPAAFALGRFLGGTTFAMMVGLAALLGTLAGTLMPWLDVERIGPFNAAAWLFTAGVIILPNYFFVCATFFGIAALTRSMAAAYAAAMALLAAWFLLAAFTGPEDLSWVVYLDPFGGAAVSEAFRYATVAERNATLPDGSILANRLIWCAAGAIILGSALQRFRFELKRPARRRLTGRNDPQTPPATAIRPDVRIVPSIAAQFTSQLRMDIRGVLRSVPFYVVLAMGILNVLGVIFGSTSQPYDTASWPVTGLVLDAIDGGFMFIVLVIVVYYAGELVWRERTARVADLMDATPFANGMVVLAKVSALWIIIALLLGVVMITGMIVQWSSGHEALEPLLYLKGLFLVNGSWFGLLALFAVCIAVVSGNRWLGMLVTVVIMLGTGVAASMGFEHNLYLFNVPEVIYSDMNGYGHFVRPYASFIVYWGLFCVLLLLAAHLLFRRGHAFSTPERLAIARSRLSPALGTAGALAGLAMAGTGAWIFYNTNVLNEYRIEEQIEAESADYEKKYRKFQSLRSLDAIDIEATVHIHPEDRSLQSRGTVILQNLTGQTVDELVMSVKPELGIEAFEIDGASVITRDDIAGFWHFRFKPAIPPDATTRARWSFTWQNPGFVNSRPNNRIVGNGTFVDSTEVMPLPGYNAGRELQDNNVRRKQGLGPVKRMPALGDPDWFDVSQFGVRTRAAFRVTLSTAADQIAIAPGYLAKEWREDGRRFFRYEMDAPIWPFFSFSSARYAVAKDRWKNVELAVYHDPKHAYNVPTMLDSAKRSLDYFTQEFSPYQYRQFRILEFPRYANFAQSFPNTIPFSESIGFISDVEDPDTINLPFYVTAHELAHQWWGHQVVGANMQGQTIIVETLAQYSALMVMEKTFGMPAMRRFLRFELDNYLSSRGGELIEELPLLLTENQPYLHYRKGSVAMYALRQTIGEAAVNRALKAFLAKYAFQPPPFPTSRDLYDHLMQETPEEYRAWAADLFERITLHDLRIAGVKVTGTPGSFTVTAEVNARKFHADGKGIETETPLDEMVDIALLPEPIEALPENVLPAPLHQARYRMVSGNNTITIRVGERPDRIVIDPGIRLIDRNPVDNIKGF